MRLSAALLAVALASPAAAQTGPASAAQTGPASAAPSPAAATAADVARIKRRLDSGTPILDAVATTAPVPTFRASVTERVDIWKFWGDPDEVAAFVRPRGGTWHNEFQAMVTPQVLRNGGAGLGNGERLQLAATGMAFAGAMKLLGIGMRQAKEALHTRTVRKAKEEVQRELEAFYLLHPEARPGAVPTPP